MEEGKEQELAAMSQKLECLRLKSLRKMMIGGDLISWQLHVQLVG